ncbi:MAG TPA: DUF3307 domain-containing protein [Anaerolineales bacterium]|nr:DUF3307 domain-containing protein [Anaerolineales bacterium]
MIWNLLLAHFMGDFLLQTDWIARKKENFSVLALHVAILFSLMVLFAGQFRNILWPYLLLIAATHLIQDRTKIVMTNKKRKQGVLFFFIDQLVHVLIIIGVIFLFESLNGPLTLPESPTWAVITLVAVILTQGWFITERIIFAEDNGYVESINQTKYSRMITRVTLTGLLYLVMSWAFPSLVLFVLTPYPQPHYRKRAMMIDLSVSVFGFLIIILASG